MLMTGMTQAEVARLRLANQRLAGTSFERPEEVVRWLGAVQSQEYASAKWGLAQRAHSLTDAAIEQAFIEGKILRTHVMRPTWHFVAPEDIRWLLRLTAPRVHLLNAYYYRQLELDGKMLTGALDLLIKILEGNRQLLRKEIGLVLRDHGITISNMQLGHILMHAELEALICSGAPRGKWHTYALLSERAPQARILTREEAVAEITRRYFASHGPATIKDFSWWSGLTIQDCRLGIALNKGQLLHEIIDEKEYWLTSPSTPPGGPICALLPHFDELTVAYTNRAAFLLDEARTSTWKQGADLLMTQAVIINGTIIGTWSRAIQQNILDLEIRLATALEPAESQAIQQAVEQYSYFLGLPLGHVVMQAI